jgi:hypothetical protein
VKLLLRNQVPIHGDTDFHWMQIINDSSFDLSMMFPIVDRVNLTGPNKSLLDQVATTPLYRV